MLINKEHNDPLIELYNSNSLEVLDKNFKRICDIFCIETFAVATLLKMNKFNINGKKEFSCFHNYPKEWMDYYEEKKYYINDPVYSFVQNITSASYWHIEKFKYITSIQKRILLEACDYGIRRGTTLPLMPNGKYNGFITLIDTNIHHPEVVYVLANASNIYVNQKDYFDLRNKFKLLTDKEMKVISLKSEGYLTKQIASELSIAEGTVIFHLSNIKRKLGLTTTEQVIFKYIKIINQI